MTNIDSSGSGDIRERLGELLAILGELRAQRLQVHGYRDDSMAMRPRLIARAAALRLRPCLLRKSLAPCRTRCRPSPRSRRHGSGSGLSLLVARRREGQDCGLADVLQREPTPLSARLVDANRVRPSMRPAGRTDDVAGAGSSYFWTLLDRVQGQSISPSNGSSSTALTSVR